MDNKDNIVINNENKDFQLIKLDIQMENKEELKVKELIFKEFNVKKDVSRFMLDICRRFKLFGKNFGKKDLFMK